MQGKNWDLIPVVESCCFFAPLQIGTVVIGAVGIFISLAAIISFATVIAILPDLIADAEDPDYAQMLTDIEVPMYVMGGIIIGLYAVNLIFNSVLIYGSHTKRVQLLRVYFWTTLALMMLDLIVAVVMCIVLPWFAGVIIFVSMKSTTTETVHFITRRLPYGAARDPCIREQIESGSTDPIIHANVRNGRSHQNTEGRHLVYDA